MEVFIFLSRKIKAYSLSPWNSLSSLVDNSFSFKTEEV